VTLSNSGATQYRCWVFTAGLRPFDFRPGSQQHSLREMGRSSLGSYSGPNWYRLDRNLRGLRCSHYSAFVRTV